VLFSVRKCVLWRLEKRWPLPTREVGIAADTGKTQIRSIFQEACTSRHSELVALLQSLPR